MIATTILTSQLCQVDWINSSVVHVSQVLSKLARTK